MLKFLLIAVFCWLPTSEGMTIPIFSGSLPKNQSSGLVSMFAPNFNTSGKLTVVQAFRFTLYEEVWIDDELVASGAVFHDVHLQRVPWAKARDICRQEGGDLAVIRSYEEENLILKKLIQNHLTFAWIGLRKTALKLHSVFGEPIKETGWYPHAEVDLHDQECGSLYMTFISIEDCSFHNAFVCKRLYGA